MAKTELKSILDEIEPDELELAQRLLSLRQEPGSELRRRVSTLTRQPQPADLSIRREQLGKLFNARSLSWGAAALVVIALLFVSPAAQATLGSFDRFIGRIHLVILEILPRYAPPQAADIKVMSLPEAQARLSFELATPAYLPAGLAAAAPEVSLLELERPVVKILWRDANGGFVQLTTHYTGQAQTLVGPESSKTILINGQPAALVRGGWDEVSQSWSHQERLTTLIWQNGRLQHKLLCFSDLVSIAELAAMAESIQ